MEVCNNVFYVVDFADVSQFTAIIHYSPDPDDCAVIRKDQVRPSTQYLLLATVSLISVQMYLCDSGGLFINHTSLSSYIEI
jgi:hypothetical protein